VDTRIKKPRKVDKPWGYELIFAHTEKYAGKVLFVRKGERLSLQYHKNKDESIYVYKGRVLIQLGGADGQMISKTLSTGDCVRIKPLTHHRIEAIINSFLFEVSTPELEDVCRLEDDYGRVH
jgi:mannose-6-phosphate isomerase-like protein (cupin superfamily)